MTSIKDIIARVQSITPDDIEITPYAARNAQERGIDLVHACKNLTSRSDVVWQISPRKGLEGQRVEAYFRVSAQRTHLYVLEVGAGVVLVNAIKINEKKQRRLDR